MTKHGETIKIFSQNVQKIFKADTDNDDKAMF